MLSLDNEFIAKRLPETPNVVKKNVIDLGHTGCQFYRKNVKDFPRYNDKEVESGVIQ